jgi:hypothetical protein
MDSRHESDELEVQRERLIEQAKQVLLSQTGIEHYAAAIRLIGTGPRYNLVASTFSTQSLKS